MKKVTYKRAKLERNRFSILTDNLDKCFLCGKQKDNLHEIFYGRNRNNSMMYGCVVPLCFDHHNLVHNDINVDNYLKKLCQKKFQEVYNDDFLSIFKRNYL